MKSADFVVWIFITIIWGIFLAWEYQIHMLAESQREYTIIYDLMALYLLLMLTAYQAYRSKD